MGKGNLSRALLITAVGFALTYVLIWVKDTAYNLVLSSKSVSGFISELNKTFNGGISPTVIQFSILATIIIFLLLASYLLYSIFYAALKFLKRGRSVSKSRRAVELLIRERGLVNNKYCKYLISSENRYLYISLILPAAEWNESHALFYENAVCFYIENDSAPYTGYDYKKDVGNKDAIAMVYLMLENTGSHLVNVFMSEENIKQSATYYFKIKSTYTSFLKTFLNILTLIPSIPYILEVSAFKVFVSQYYWSKYKEIFDTYCRDEFWPFYYDGSHELKEGPKNLVLDKIIYEFDISAPVAKIMFVDDIESKNSLATKLDITSSSLMLIYQTEALTYLFDPFNQEIADIVQELSSG